MTDPATFQREVIDPLVEQMYKLARERGLTLGEAQAIVLRALERRLQEMAEARDA